PRTRGHTPARWRGRRPWRRWRGPRRWWSCGPAFFNLQRRLSFLLGFRESPVQLSHTGERRHKARKLTLADVQLPDVVIGTRCLHNVDAVDVARRDYHRPPAVVADVPAPASAFATAATEPRACPLTAPPSPRYVLPRIRAWFTAPNAL